MKIKTKALAEMARAFGMKLEPVLEIRKKSMGN
jgi:hypothetical protein